LLVQHRDERGEGWTVTAGLQAEEEEAHLFVCSKRAYTRAPTNSMQQRWEEEERRGTAMQKACSELKCQADQQGHHCMQGENKRIIRLIMPAQTGAPILHAMPGRACIHSYLVNSPPKLQDKQEVIAITSKPLN
jgi:hypothetical protein